jgi:triosephosphate isomerase
MIIAANWKQYLSPQEENALLLDFGSKLKTHAGQDLWIFPSLYSLICLTKTAKALAMPILVGAQDIAPTLDGAQTGGIRADYIRNELVLIGHSERRKIFHEKVSDIKKKLQVALDTNKQVILCLGEKKPLSDDEIIEHVTSELDEYKEIIDGRKERVIIAYEPWWAIGGSKAPSVQTIEKVAKALHKLGFAKVLYGGSVDPHTISRILSPELAGFLVGRASTTLPIFQSILDQLNKE